MFIDQYILIGVHLSSSDKKNKPQVVDLLRAIKRLKQSSPHSHIICGGDVNSFIGCDHEEWDEQFQMYPKERASLTTSKKRTRTQAQWKKADKHDIESKDKIMTDLTILEQGSSITLIDSTPFEESLLLPRDDHPFDHAVVTVKLQRP